MVYFIRDTVVHAIKIGSSDDPGARLSGLQTGNWAELTILAMIEGDATTERELHKRFAKYAIRGEWFRLEGELALYLIEIAQCAQCKGKVGNTCYIKRPKPVNPSVLELEAKLKAALK